MWEVYSGRTKVPGLGCCEYSGYLGEVETQTATAAACEIRAYMKDAHPVLWVVRSDGSNAHQIEFDGQDLTVLEVEP